MMKKAPENRRPFLFLMIPQPGPGDKYYSFTQMLVRMVVTFQFFHSRSPE